MKELSIFVYGTLKRNGKLHSNMQNFNFISNGYIQNTTLLNCGWYPGIIESANKLDTVYGEIYFPEKNYNNLISQLDLVEGYSVGSNNSSLFIRKKINVYKIDTLEIIKCWGYYWNGLTNLPHTRIDVW